MQAITQERLKKLLPALAKDKSLKREASGGVHSSISYYRMDGDRKTEIASIVCFADGHFTVGGSFFAPHLAKFFEEDRAKERKKNLTALNKKLVDLGLAPEGEPETTPEPDIEEKEADPLKDPPGTWEQRGEKHYCKICKSTVGNKRVHIISKGHQNRLREALAAAAVTADDSTEE